MDIGTSLHQIYLVGKYSMAAKILSSSKQLFILKN